MAVVIRMRRLGAKKRPTYRFVATDSRMPRDGRFLETLGYYNPIEKPATVKIFEDKAAYWLDKGAQMSDTVAALFKQIGFAKKYAMMKKGEDVSDITLKETITERPKKRKRKKQEVKKESEV
ncbi:MAG: 30S ribosomal protein S16 [Candidatus Zixiibacteriota bacterium]|nr:MAG: 30S ribosomal protein S16 [candidate division Zixibacteria bacterium]HHI03193.1 30S ribosomal protein S16 [candidate division Zixibacteria bacterium]